MRKLMSLLTVSMIMFSCGGGGSSTEETTTVSSQVPGTETTVQQPESTPTTTSQPTAPSTLTGYAVDDYILNGTVKVYDIRTGELIANTTTTEGDLTAENEDTIILDCFVVGEDYKKKRSA